MPHPQPLRAASVLLVSLLAALPAHAQTSPALGLMGEGDVLSNGEIADAIFEAHVHDSGVWVAQVLTDAGHTVVVRNGTVVLQPGDVIHTGETVSNIKDIDLGPTGVLAYAMTVEDATGTFRNVIYTLGAVFVSSLDSFPDPAGSPDPYDITSFSEVAIAFPYMVIECRARGGGDPIYRDINIRYDFSTPLSPTVDILSEEGKTAPGGGTYGPRPVITPRVDVLPDGRALTWSTIAGDDVVLYDGVLVARDNQTAPDAGYRWTGGGVYDARISSAGHLMLAGDVDFASGLFAGRRIFVDGVMRVDSGQPFGSGTSGPYFYRGIVDSAGRLHYTHDAGPVAGYALDGRMMMEEGLCEASGQTVTYFSGFDLEDASDSGELVLLEVAVGGFPGTERLVLLETDLGNIVGSCPTVANTTGAVATLEASGSTRLGVGAFPMTAVDMPPFQAGLLLCSLTSNVTLNPAGSTGNLCLGGAIGRFMAQIGVSDAGGTLGFTVDPGALPQGAGLIPAAAGEVWGFQVWHRDTTPTGPTSNFSETRAIGFR